MKKIYNQPEVDFIKLSAKDVLATSYGYAGFNFDENDKLDPWAW